MIWLPVESDSEIITKYAHKLGLKEEFQFIDLYSFDPKTAEEFGIPTDRCKGMILLFPLSNGEEGKSDESLGKNNCNPIPLNGSPIFIKQTIENSCCLMALLHILLNNPNELLRQGSINESLLRAEDKVKFIEESEELKMIHEEMARCGGEGAETISVDDEVPFHFVSLIPTDSNLFVMDGRSSGPLKFEYSNSQMNFFEAACKVAREEFVEKSVDDQINFAAVILI